MSSFSLRQRLLEIARQHAGKTEVSRNQAPWITPLWEATTYPSGWKEREPYCAAGVAWCVREWLRDPEVRQALGLRTAAAAESWRCKSASCFKQADSWSNWARLRKLRILRRNDVFHAGDIIIYDFSHIELYVTDLPGKSRPFTAIGFNTDSGGGRDGDGCWEKPRSRSTIKEVIRMLA